MVSAAACASAAPGSFAAPYLGGAEAVVYGEELPDPRVDQGVVAADDPADNLAGGLVAAAYAGGIAAGALGAGSEERGAVSVERQTNARPPSDEHPFRYVGVPSSTTCLVITRLTT